MTRTVVIAVVVGLFACQTEQVRPQTDFPAEASEGRESPAQGPTESGTPPKAVDGYDLDDALDLATYNKWSRWIDSACSKEFSGLLRWSFVQGRDPTPLYRAGQSNTPVTVVPLASSGSTTTFECDLNWKPQQESSFRVWDHKEFVFGCSPYEMFVLLRRQNLDTPLGIPDRFGFAWETSAPFQTEWTYTGVDGVVHHQPFSTGLRYAAGFGGFRCASGRLTPDASP